ncbi:AraC-type DNA-binding protein [Saccharopolyspora antimicrobica]|uniref:AraC family transcriptional regulator n=1 Tax=Saccharopolyspora antimicrobica TaxID=455193 RepID=A0A1I5E8F6_9PSEU|nr:AraC family transcriptional regulator [Saccharopolyspora antimicrobica]RKT86705.1 AraC family transcriptional regulator [Saccharopolyspora antimicrobica]SFO07556.1 AraC-type DNA-binding protein [Saccharopolyspora antimicrobica]
MDRDQLSEVFDLIEVRGVLSGGFAERGRWVSRGELRTALKFFALVSGHARLTTDGIDAPIELEPGDVAVLNNRSWLELEGGTGAGPRSEITPEDPSADLVGVDLGTDDVLVGGRVELDPAGQALLQALPPVGHIRGSTAESATLRGTIRRVFDEVSNRRIGAEFAIRQHAQLLVLEMMRVYSDQAELPPGWLRLLTDERLRPAIGLMHAEPGKAWSLDELSRAAAMSRSSFAERFRAVAGVPPLTYLGRWRMLLGQRALRDSDVRIGALAAELGYTSESAFSTAFKRHVGLSPLRYRQRLRTRELALNGASTAAERADGRTGAARRITAQSAESRR